MLIDTHCHVIATDTKKYPLKPLYGKQSDWSAEHPLDYPDMVKADAAAGVDKAALVQASSAYGFDNSYVTDSVKAHPERFTGLVYLDGAYDRSGGLPQTSRLRELNHRLPPEPPVPPDALHSYEAMRRYLAASGHVRLPEGELIAFLNIDKPFLAGTPAIDARTQQAIAAAIQPPNYSRIRIPALAIYAFDDPDKPLPPWCDPHDAGIKATTASA